MYSPPVDDPIQYEQEEWEKWKDWAETTHPRSIPVEEPPPAPVSPGVTQARVLESRETAAIENRNTRVLALEIPPEVLFDRFERLKALRANILRCEAEIRVLGGETAMHYRYQQNCLRCGYQWYPYNQFVSPRACPQCGSSAWHTPPTTKSRKPGDPLPSSREGRRIRKGARKPKFRVDLESRERKQVIEQAEIDAAEQVQVNAPPYIPPHILAALPPPPAPAPFGSLSAHLARIVTSEEQMEEQPERMASRPQPAPEEIPPAVISGPEPVLDVPDDEAELNRLADNDPDPPSPELPPEEPWPVRPTE